MSITLDGRGAAWNWWVPNGESRSATVTVTDGAGDAVAVTVTGTIEGSDETFGIDPVSTGIVTVTSPAGLPAGFVGKYSLIANGSTFATGTFRHTHPGDPRLAQFVEEASFVLGELNVAITMVGGSSGGGSAEFPAGGDDGDVLILTNAETRAVGWGAGTPGPQGPAGATGPQGPAGATGATGPQGPQGPQGETGATGPQGETGPAGAAGADGDDGASAYEVAVAAGFVGDEAAWLASLVGPQGPQGPQGETGATGATGPQGETGATGATGATGPEGPQGPEGPTGPAGTTDYNALDNLPDLSQYATLQVTVGSALGTSGTVNLDMAALTGTYQTIPVSGAITFTTSNRANGRQVTLRLTENGTASRAITWPAGWVTLHAALPTTIDNETVVVSITFFGTADADAVVTAGVSV